MSQIDELRQIIVGDDADTLRELKDRIESIEKRTNDVAEVLPDAITERIALDSRLTDALKEPVFRGLKDAIRNEPNAYAEILYPVMAPSIRRAITQALSSMLVTINQTIHSATTAQGLKYRFEAWTTGVPYAELMLRQTAPFMVEHVYLIDRDSGLLVKEAHAEGVKSLDGDAVGAMFSAIQSFVQDSFSANKQSRLTDFKSEHQSDNQNIWIVHGADMMLACVISGNAPESIREKLYDTLDQIHVDYSNQTSNYDGDASIFKGIHTYLNPLVELDENTKEVKQASIAKYIIPILLVFGVMAIGIYLFERGQVLSTIKHQIQATPGIAITNAYWDDGKVIVEGLQDPDAVIAYDDLKAKKIDKDLIVFKTIPFRSLESSMELQRFDKEFSLPGEITFVVEDNKIQMLGQPSIGWLNSHDLRIRQLAADGRLGITGLSASTDSVDVLIKTEFDKSELSQISSTITVGTNNQDVVQLYGRMPARSLNRLKALFLNNYWVDIAVFPN